MSTSGWSTVERALRLTDFMCVFKKHHAVGARNLFEVTDWL